MTSEDRVSLVGIYLADFDVKLGSTTIALLEGVFKLNPNHMYEMM